MKTVKPGQIYVGCLSRYYSNGVLPDGVPPKWWFTHGSFLLEVVQTQKFIFTFQQYRVLPNGTRIAHPSLKQARKSELVHEVKMRNLILEKLTLWQRIVRFCFPRETKVLRLVQGNRHDGEDLPKRN